MMCPIADAMVQDINVPIQEYEIELTRRVFPQPIPVHFSKRRTRRDDTFTPTAGTSQFAPNKIEPGPAVLIGQSNSICHFGDILAGVKLVTLQQPISKFFGQTFCYRGFSRATYAHDDDG